MRRPLVSITLDLEDGTYNVQPYTVGPVAASAFGEPTVVSQDDFESHIAGAVLENLAKFGKEKFDLSRATRLNSSQQRAFIKRHLFVSVFRDESSGLVIFPKRRVRGGTEARDEDTITLSESDLPHKLPEAIAEALRRAR